MANQDLTLADLAPLLPDKSGESARMLFGTVAATDPLTVVIDGDTTPTPAASCVAPAIGNRVVLLLQGRVLVAMGVVTG